MATLGYTEAVTWSFTGETEARPFLEDEAFRPVQVTVSVGTAGASTYPIEPDELLARADAACYRAKEAGRNRVEAAAA